MTLQLLLQVGLEIYIKMTLRGGESWKDQWPLALAADQLKDPTPEDY